jgi:antitoxin component YwqK of YwqJK toxin-antitoxin module
VKFSTLFLFSFLLTYSLFAQKRFVYYFDSKFNSVPKSNAVITGRGIKTETGVTVSFFYTQTQKLFNICNYTDSTLSVLNGKNIDYYENGKVKQSDTFNNNILNGVTEKWDSTGLRTDSIIYANDKMQNKTQFEYDFSRNVSRKIFTDSVQNTMTDIFLNTAGKKVSEVHFNGNKGVWIHYNTDGSISKKEEVLTKEKNNATFIGGEEVWKDYLAKELNTLLPFDNGAPKGEYVVFVSFTVDKDGTVSNIMPTTKHGFGMEEEAVRVIQKSGKWTPATIYGKAIKSHRLQPIQFGMY